MYELPTSIIIEDTSYSIRNAGDYRMVLDCFAALQDAELTKEERVVVSLAIFYEGVLSLNKDVKDVFTIFNTPEKFKEAVDSMFDFFNCGGTNIGNKVPYKLLDWEADSQMISSAINKVAGTEVRSVPYMHWWTFLGYYNSVGESVLSTVVTIRSKIMKGKKLESHEKEFRKENPQYFIWNSATVEQEEINQLGDSLWNAE